MSMPDPCRNVTNKYANCQNAAALISCENAIAIKQCGVAAACLYKKFSTLESCNQPNLGNCDICPSLTAAKNPIAALCDDDQWNSSPQTFVSILALFLIIFINFFLQA
uniref:Uncharacterized protein n=1 Tax=Panagrolaimus sp. ES5 TaxID=591445 RepID=A0AC34FZR2_9BILA